MPNVYQFKDFDGSSHRILIGLIRHYCRRRGSLLDLGAAGGELGASVRSSFDKTIGFEYDVDRLPALRQRFDQAVIADLESVRSIPGNLEAVVLADVLEHLRDPAQILRLVRRAINHEGLLFVSVPNIANVTTRIGLLFGVFRYRERGILDATHLRFYTRGTIEEELRKAGFEIVTARASAVPIRLILGTYVPSAMLLPLEWLLARVTQLWKSLLGYQIILVARAAR